MINDSVVLMSLVTGLYQVQLTLPSIGVPITQWSMGSIVCGLRRKNTGMNRRELVILMESVVIIHK